MTDTPLRVLTLAAARAVRGEHGVEALRDLVLERAEESGDNAVIDVCADLPDLADGPLHGLPFAVKDNIDCGRFPTTGGSPALAGFRPEASAPVVAALEAAGGWVPFKCNLHELAFGVTSNNATYGPVRNPFDPARVAGGSSGGNAAAIARGLVPFALGTDTGGSTRIPAAFCGIVGFRPSTGRYRSGGVLTLSTTRDTIGPMAANVVDIAEVDGLIVPAEADRGSLPVGRPLRVGRLQVQRGSSAAVDDALDAALAELVSAEVAELIQVVEPAFDDLDDRFGNAVVFAEAAAFWSSFCRDRLGLALEEFASMIASPDVRGAFEAIADLGVEAGEHRRQVLDHDVPELSAAYRQVFARHELDLVVSPTVCVPPPLIGEDDMMATDDGARSTFATITSTTALATLVGAPSLALPAGSDRDGLPVSLMFEGLPGTDRDLLLACRAIEAALDT